MINPEYLEVAHNLTRACFWRGMSRKEYVYLMGVYEALLCNWRWG